MPAFSRHRVAISTHVLGVLRALDLLAATLGVNVRDLLKSPLSVYESTPALPSVGRISEDDDSSCVGDR